MPPKRSLAFILSKASVVGRTITRSDDDSVEVSSEVTPSVQRQLHFSSTSLPTTRVSPTPPDMTSSPTETSTPTIEPPTLDIRINSRRNRVEPTVQSTEQPVRKKARRGLVTGKAIKRDIANNENRRLPLKWNMETKLPDSNNVGRITKQIGCIVREHVPMLKDSYLELPQDDLKIVVDQLSVFFEIDWNGDPGDALFEWIHVTARHAYTSWRSQCHKLYKSQGRHPIPLNFIHRPDQWDFLCTLYEKETWKKKSKRMTETRLSKKWIKHKGGPVLFRVRANKHRASGHVAPHLATIVETTTNEDRKRLVEEAIEKIKNDYPIDTSDSPMPCPIEKEISIIEEIVGPSVGTAVRGMGSLPVRAPKMRGPMKGTSKPVSTVNEDDLQQQLAERDEEIRLLKEAQDEAKKEAAKQRDEIAAQRNLLEILSKKMEVNDANSNSTPTSHALG